jgi:hypothetical protein
LKGSAYFAKFGLEYPVATRCQIVLYIAAAVTRDGHFHGASVVAMLLYQAYWSLRYFGTLT